MARVWTRLAYGAGIASAAAFLLAVALLGLINTGPGQHWVGSLVEPMTGGKVSITELRGRFPGSLHVKRVELRDPKGVWLRVDDATIVWSPFALRENRLHIARLEAASASLMRLPESDTNAGGSDFRVDIDRLKIAKLETAASLSGRPGIFAAEGSIHYASLRDASANLTLERKDETAHYRVDATLRDGTITGFAMVEEEAAGLLATISGVEHIGPIAIDARASGSSGVNAIEIRAKAGALEAAATGTLDLGSAQTELNFSVHAPAMKARPGLSWKALDGQGRIVGALNQPIVSGHLEIDTFALDGNSAEHISADVAGQAGGLDFSGQFLAVRIRDLDPKFLEHAPMLVKGHAELRPPLRSVSATISHPVIAINGVYNLGRQTRMTASIAVPDLKSFAALVNVPLAGRASISGSASFNGDAIQIQSEGRIEQKGRDDPLARLFGKDVRIVLAADVQGTKVAISNVQLSGAGTEARIKGNLDDSELDLSGSVSLADVSRLTPALIGNTRLQLTARGPWKQTRIELRGEGDLAPPGFTKERVTLAANANGLTKPLSGQFRTQGGFDGAPLAVNGGFLWAGDEVSFRIDRGEWRSLRAEGKVALSHGQLATGQASVSVGRLQDLPVLFDGSVSGRLDAVLNFTRVHNKPAANIDAKLHNIALNALQVPEATVKGEISDLVRSPILAIDIDAPAMDMAGVRASTAARLTGPLDAPIIHLSMDVPDLRGAAAKFLSSATLGKGGGEIILTSFSGRYQGAVVALAAPARIDLRQGVSFTEVRAKLGKGEIAIQGAIAPSLNASLRIQNLDAKTLQPFLPQLEQATVGGTAKLSGTLAAPSGTLDVQARDLRLRGVPVGISRGRVDVHVDLSGTSGLVTAAVDAGSMTHLVVKGEVPLTADRAFDLSADGNFDLAMLNPVLSVDGRTLLGKGVIKATLGGTYDKPRITGTVNVTGGEYQDIVHGQRVTGVTMTANATGTSLRIVRFSGRSGQGTISGTGVIDLTGRGFPVDMTLNAERARLVAKDRLTATVNGELKLRGSLTQGLTLSGTAEIVRADVSLPDSLPRQVVVLNVLRAGENPRRQNASAAPMTLDVRVNSPGQFFVRGRGLNAEVEGQIHVGGTEMAPLVTGGLTLRRGELSLAGQTLDITSGKLTFDGVSLRNGLDPALDFQSQTTSNGITARVAVTGYASSPRIQLSSTPSSPQDEILARLIFQQSVSQLSPLQLAQIAQAAAALGGAGTDFNPLTSIRETLGLDRLNVGSASDPRTGEAATTVEAGRYVTRRVYVGTKQSLSGGTEAEVLVDLTKNLKVQGTVNTGANATVTQGAAHDQIGTSIGLSYQFEY